MGNGTLSIPQYQPTKREVLGRMFKNFSEKESCRKLKDYVSGLFAEQAYTFIGVSCNSPVFKGALEAIVKNKFAMTSYNWGQVTGAAIDTGIVVGLMSHYTTLNELNPNMAGLENACVNIFLAKVVTQIGAALTRNYQRTKQQLVEERNN